MSMAFFATDQSKANARQRCASIAHRKAIAPAMQAMTPAERQALIDEAIAAGRVSKCPQGPRYQVHIPNYSGGNLVRRHVGSHGGHEG